MKSIPSLVFACLLVCSIARPSLGATYYVRTDGGTDTQCNGPGRRGLSRVRHWPKLRLVPSVLGPEHPRYRILEACGRRCPSSSDRGEYQMGYGAPNTDWCETDYPWSCDLPPLPSGARRIHSHSDLRKRVGYRLRRSAPVVGNPGASPQIISLENTNNAQVGCLEITDHSQCVEFHSDPAMTCQRDNWPYGGLGRNRHPGHGFLRCVFVRPQHSRHGLRGGEGRADFQLDRGAGALAAQRLGGVGRGCGRG